MRLIELLLKNSVVADESWATRMHKEMGARVNGRRVEGDDMDDFEVSPGDILQVGPYQWAFVADEGEIHVKGAFSLPSDGLPPIYLKSGT